MATVNPILNGNVIELKVGGLILGRKTLWVSRWIVQNADLINAYAVAIGNIGGAFFASPLYTAYRAVLPTNWTVDWYSAQRIAESPTAFPAVRSKGLRALVTGQSGTWAGAICNQPASAAAVERFSFMSGKTQQGEFHIGPTPDDAIVNGALTAPYITALGSFANLSVSALTYSTTGLLAPGGFHTKTKGAPNQPNFQAFIAYSLGRLYSSERRRRGRPFGR